MDARAYARIRERLPAIEAERRVALALLTAAWTVLPGLGAALGAYLVGLGGDWRHLLGSLAGGAGAAAWLSPHLLYPYKRKFKLEVIKPLLEGSLEGVEYAPLGSVSHLDLEASLLFRSVPPEEVTGEDLVIGRRSGVAVRFSEVRAGGGLKLGRDGRPVYRPPVFRGLFFVADFNRKSPGIVVVYPEGWLARPLLELPPVSLEDPRFERAFKVFASDPVYAFYVLSPSLMEAIWEFSREAGKLAFSVVYGKLYLAVPGPKNRLEPPLFSSLRSPSLYRGFLREVGGFLRLVDALRLNRRIWG